MAMFNDNMCHGETRTKGIRMNDDYSQTSVWNKSTSDGNVITNESSLQTRDGRLHKNFETLKKYRKWKDL